MADITIPADALEASARAIADVEYPRLPPRKEHYEMARAACLAMINAWPGMHFTEFDDGQNAVQLRREITLPLPQEDSDEQ